MESLGLRTLRLRSIGWGYFSSLEYVHRISLYTYKRLGMTLTQHRYRLDYSHCRFLVAILRLPHIQMTVSP